jgi:g-D-glutamyl-meso-diaminopimelate peptidase
VPLVNPDGCEIALKGEIGAGQQSGFARRISGGDFASWNANARGVDINHNFDAGWETLQKMEREAGIWGPSIRRYGGPCPASEPETRALTALCRNRDILTVLAFHSQGEEIYWSYGKNTPLRSKKLARIFAASSGYAVEEPMGLASHGGFKDWFIQEFCRPGFTIEIGRGKNPLDPALLEEVYARIEEMMMLACAM